MINPVFDAHGTQSGHAVIVPPQHLETLPDAILAATLRTWTGADSHPPADMSIIIRCESIGSDNREDVQLWLDGFIGGFEPAIPADSHRPSGVYDGVGVLQGWSVRFPVAQLGQLPSAVKAGYRALNAADGRERPPILYVEVPCATHTTAGSSIESWTAVFGLRWTTGCVIRLNNEAGLLAKLDSTLRGLFDPVFTRRP